MGRGMQFTGALSATERLYGVEGCSSIGGSLIKKRDLYSEHLKKHMGGAL